MYEFLSRLYPKGIRESIFTQLEYFSLRTRKEFIVGSILFFSFGFTLSFAFQFSGNIFPAMAPVMALILVFLVSFITLQVVVYTIINIVITNRGRFVETILPDVLQLIAANLRAGMTIDRALMSSNRIEFGYFNEQFAMVGKEITTGTEIGDALMHMTKRIKSIKFKKSIELIVTGMKSGGELSRLLSQVAENLVHQKTVEEKVKGNVTTYLIFIGAAVGFAAPVLYGLSTVIVKVIVTTFSSVEIPAGSNMPFSINMSPELAEFLPIFVKTYAKVSLFTLSITASFILGLIKKGEVKYGLGYIPGIAAISLLLYFAVATGATKLFDSLL